MNKKGAILHWIIFGMFVVGGMAFIALMDKDPGLGIRGAWEFSFISVFQDAEVSLLRQEVDLRTISREVLQGMTQEIASASDCGALEFEGYSVPLLNTPDRFCYLDYSALYLEKFKERVEQQYPGQYSPEGIRFSGTDVIGVPTENTILEPVVSGVPANLGLFPYQRTYEYNPGFRINLEPEFAVWRIILTEAPLFIDNCKDEPDLENCVYDHNRRPSARWDDSYTNCFYDVEEVDRKITFCMTSDNAIFYSFALDFNPR